jgi:hypothetical protein
MVDATGLSNRIMPWITWKYGIQGELYYTINEVYSRRDKDAWNDVYLFGGNGDGTLVYPGLPQNIGGRTDIPIESIRLKLIREGLEDYEYLVFLSGRVDRSAVKEFVNKMVTNTYTYERDSGKFYALRRMIGETISKNGALTN